MKVIIAEKPSVARDIAAIVGANNRKDGYLEGGGYAVTWAFGHLVGLAMPEQYGFTGFQRENLPILPSQFKLIPRQLKDGKEYKPDPGTMKQLKVIKELFGKCDKIIVATDAGREGELIFRYIYNYLECSRPFDRLWISSLTDQAIRKGMENLIPGEDYDNLYASAKARSQADWIVGINASQALSLSAGHGVWSLGRVQTPTLAMICSRYLENKDFVPQPYFQLKLHTAKDDTAFAAISVERYLAKTEAEERLSRVRSGEVKVVSVEKKEVRQEAPLLYDLTTLQKDMNSKYGYSADKTLSIAQKLYEAKLITYPRTGSRYISEDVFEGIYDLISTLWEHPMFGTQAVAVSNSELNRHSVNDGKVTDHHALLITGNEPKELPDDEHKVYERIAGRMVEAFSKICIKDATTIKLECADVLFEVKGSVTKSAGWRKVWGEQEEKEDNEVTALPDLSENEILSVQDVELLEKQTKPRPLHTESSLLSAMETCGKELTNEAQREALKESGIGTPATRAAVIETLFSRDYIKREKKSLAPTNKGLVVYLAVKEKKISDVAMTGQWESALNKIATGEMDADTFHRGIEVYATQITTELLDNKIEGGDNRESCPCPKCKNGQVTIYRKVAKCNNESCGLTIFRNKSEKKLTDGQIKDLLTKGKTTVIKGFKSREGKSFDAAVTFDNDFKTVFSFPPKTGGKKRGK